MNRRLIVATGLSAIVLAGCGSAPATIGAVNANSTQATSQATTLTASQIAARMNVGKFTAFNEKTDPNNLMGRMGGYTSKVQWGSDDPKSGIEVFPDVADATKRLDLLKSFNGSFIGDGYDYISGTAILRLSTSYLPSQATALDAKFNALTS